MMGLPEIGNKHFGTFLVKDSSRRPWPGTKNNCFQQEDICFNAAHCSYFKIQFYSISWS